MITLQIINRPGVAVAVLQSPLLGKTSAEKISFCLEKVQMALTPPAHYFWNPLRKFLKNPILDKLKFLKMFRFWSSLKNYQTKGGKKSFIKCLEFGQKFPNTNNNKKFLKQFGFGHNLPPPPPFELFSNRRK